MKDFVKELGKSVVLSLSLEIFKIGLDVIRSVNRSTIIIDERDNGFLRVNKVLYNLDPVKYSRYRIPTTEADLFHLSIGANYFIKLNNDTFIHVISHNDENNKNTSIKKLVLHFYGKDKFKYREKFSKCVAKNKNKKYIEIIPIGSRNYYNPNTLLSISFDEVILKKDIKDKIVNGLHNWRNDKQWYYDNKMIYKMGVLLYGAPGTGKSTIVKCISNMFGNVPILTINGSNVKGSAMELLYHRKSTSASEALIVLLEDFDMFFNNRENKKDNEDSDSNFSKDENMNALFQMLDGVYSTQNTIYIATTNYIDRIDPALIRTGRFDIQVELNYFSKQDSIDYIHGLGMDVSILDTLNLEFPVQPSLLRNSVLEYRAQNYINGGN